MLFVASFSFVGLFQYILAFPERFEPLTKLSASQLEGQKVTSFIYRSNVDIEIKCLREHVEPLKVAQCETALKTCYLMNQNFGENYGVSYSSRGIVFNVIRSYETTCESYLFCETQNITKCTRATIEDSESNNAETQAATCRRDIQNADLALSAVIVFLIVLLGIKKDCIKPMKGVRLSLWKKKERLKWKKASKRNRTTIERKLSNEYLPTSVTNQTIRIELEQPSTRNAEEMKPLK